MQKNPVVTCALAAGEGRGEGPREASRAQLFRSALLAQAGFAHGFSTRVGGVSGALPETEGLRSLNFGRAHDTKDNIVENTRRLAAAIGFDPHALFEVSQVHGARVLVAPADPVASFREEADAIVGFARGDRRGGEENERAGEGGYARRAVGVRIADCTPVLVGDPASGAVVAIHAGWRGVVANVVAAGVASLGAGDRSALVAAIGPSIGRCCFEVGDDVAAQIAGASGVDKAIVARPSGRPHVDMRIAVRAQLRTAGLIDARIDDVAGCTKCDAGTFFSFRRDGDASGRHLAVICPRA